MDDHIGQGNANGFMGRVDSLGRLGRGPIDRLLKSSLQNITHVSWRSEGPPIYYSLNSSVRYSCIVPQ